MKIRKLDEATQFSAGHVLPNARHTGKYREVADSPYTSEPAPVNRIPKDTDVTMQIAMLLIMARLNKLGLLANDTAPDWIKNQQYINLHTLGALIATIEGNLSLPNLQNLIKHYNNIAGYFWENHEPYELDPDDPEKKIHTGAAILTGGGTLPKGLEIIENPIYRPIDVFKLVTVRGNDSWVGFGEQFWTFYSIFANTSGHDDLEAYRFNKIFGHPAKYFMDIAEETVDAKFVSAMNSAEKALQDTQLYANGAPYKNFEEAVKVSHNKTYKPAYTDLDEVENDMVGNKYRDYTVNEIEDGDIKETPKKEPEFYDMSSFFDEDSDTPKKEPEFYDASSLFDEDEVKDSSKSKTKKSSKSSKKKDKDDKEAVEEGFSPVISISPIARKSRKAFYKFIFGTEEGYTDDFDFSDYLTDDDSILDMVAVNNGLDMSRFKCYLTNDWRNN